MAVALYEPRNNDPQNPAPVRWQQSRAGALGPRLGFAAAIVACLAAWTAATATLPSDAVVPVVSTLVLVLAGAFGVIAWCRGRMNPDNVTYADVAGALTLIGLCAAATIDPDQMVRLVADGRTPE